MFGKSLSPMALLAAIALLALLALPGVAQAQGNSTASGGGIYNFREFLPVTFSFTAVQLEDGAAVGNAEFYVEKGTEFRRIHVQIDCADFYASESGVPQATLSGIITNVESSTPGDKELLEGRRIVFSVQDGGEGNQGEDLISDFVPGMFVADDVDCHVLHPLPQRRVERGNIQVHVR